MMFVVGDPVVHRLNNKKGKIVAVSQKYGWYRVRHADGFEREYQGNLAPSKLMWRIDLGEM